MNPVSVFSTSTSTSKYCILNCEPHEIMNYASSEQIQSCGIKIQMNKHMYYGDFYVNVYFEGELSNLSNLIHLLKPEYENEDDNIHEQHLPEQIIIELYKKYGIDHTLQLLDGIFIFLLFDYDFNNETSSLYVVSDRFGRMPLYTHQHHKKFMISNHVSFPGIQTKGIENRASAYTLYHLSSKILSKWEHVQTNIYYTLPANVYLHAQTTYNEYKTKMKTYMEYNGDENPFLKVKKEKYVNAFDFDFEIRGQLYNDRKLTNSVFYDKEFIVFYFSIPLEIRYQYHEELFALK